ncbi:hypothetical protein [Streptosporangium sp. NPDC048865]|uniref:hypothetical protein n=1 Tax=Streptosporangium sp. NPDC048865 TaxID=3155766 RepID=UPI0034331594
MVAPVSPNTGDYISKAFWDREVTDRWNALYDPWTAYTPTWSATTTPPVLGNGALVAAYKLIDSTSKTVHLRLRLSTGSTTSYGSGFWTFTLPDGLAPSVVQTIHGFCGNNDGTVRYPLAAQLTSAGGIERIAAAGSTGVTSSSPFTWATTHQLLLSGTYQIT